MFSVTATCRVEPSAAVKVTELVLGPTGSPAGLTVTRAVAGAPPLAGLTLTHGCAACAVQVSDPPPVFVTLTSCPGGAGRP